MGSDPVLHVQRSLAECFRLLAVCFYPPQPAVWLEEALPQNLVTVLVRTCPAAAEHARRMQESVGRVAAEELAVEHARLFVGPQRVIAPPYGSVYLEEGRRVMGQSTREAARAYEEAGLRLDADFKELPDHVAVELEFAYYLTSRAVAAAEAGNAEEARTCESAREAFLDRHLRRWVPPFCARIAEGTENAFYGNLAKCLDAFVVQGSPDTNRASR